MGWSLSDIGNAVSSRAQAARNALSHGVDTVTSTASSAARSVTTTVSRTASTIASTARDLGTAARDRAVDLGRAGMDLGRRGVEAARSFDVREAAATARQGISTATEAARDGITTATEWSSARVGDVSDYARSHVNGDDLASRAFRGVVTGAESMTRFQLGVTGGITREVASTVGAVGQLAVTATEMQVSQEARIEYGTAIVNTVADAGRATGGYLGSVADDPSRLASDAQGAWDATSGFVGDTASRYGQAIREGQTEEIGMDVGTVATYVVPVGGGPARGALTAAVRTGVREGGEIAARWTAAALTRGGGEAIARTTVREGGEAIGRGTTEMAAASTQTGREIAVFRDGVTGRQQMVTEVPSAPHTPVRTVDPAPPTRPTGEAPSSAPSANGVPASTIAETAKRTGLSEDRIRAILDTPKPDRPTPASYLPDDRIATHLHSFEETGAIKFTPKSTLDTYGTLGPPDGGFVISRETFERLIQDTGGDLAKVEESLQLRPGELTSGDTVIAYIEPKDLQGLRMPSGNERGAWDGLWVPGGYTGKGVAEAVVDLPAGTPYTPITLGD